jgi:DNA-binding transcriptional ArsR family regulator
LVNNQQRRISAVFTALADPTRRRILAGLSAGGGSPVATLAKPFRISPPAISRHLRVLEKAGLIDRHREGRRHMIRARPAGLRDAQHWLAGCAAAWQYSFDHLDQLIQKEHGKERQS